MSRRIIYLIRVWALTAVIALSSTSRSNAESIKVPNAADSPYDLINAVNALRASYGLSPYRINSILMYTAQAQADFMAATGNVTHSGPGGVGLTDRLLAAGYPLAGDLSAGGFRAENITSGDESRSAESAVNGWTGDAPHLNTMISPNLTEIGAGVAVANGRVYFVIDCASPTTDGAPQESDSIVGAGSAVPARDAPIPPAVISTPNSSGEIIHEVQAGQSLWQIAIAYEVKIDDIKRLNNLSGNDIYPGNRLLIKTGVILPMALPTEAPTSMAATSPAPVSLFTATVSQPTVTVTPAATLAVSRTSDQNRRTIGIVAGIITLAILGGVFTMLGSAKK